MLSADRIEFEEQLAILCAGFNVPATAHRKHAYFAGLARMSLGQFVRCVEFALSDDGPDALPTTRELWKIHQHHKPVPPRPAEPAPDLEPKWLRCVNGMFLKYLQKRRSGEQFRGDINLPARRAFCVELVRFFEGMEAERDPEATEADMQLRFDQAMRRIPDLSADEAWLARRIAQHQADDNAHGVYAPMGRNG